MLTPHRMLLLLVVNICQLSACCPGLMSNQTASCGLPSNGFLLRGTALRTAGPGYRLARPDGDARWGTTNLVAALKRAAAAVSRGFPDTRPLRVGDLSGSHGGFHRRHGSHRTGRDADVLFYVTDAAGRPRESSGWYAFASDGRGRGGASQEYWFDDARNWFFVRHLLLDPRVQVQWIFCSRGVKTRLLNYAVEHEPSPKAITQALYVLHQPSAGRAHDDHFHIRVHCTPDEVNDGCQEQPPRWPWNTNQTSRHLAALTDQLLLMELLGDLP